MGTSSAMVRACAAVAAGAIASAGVGAGSDVRLFGVTWGGTLAEFNPQTGQALSETSLGVPFLNSMSGGPDGAFFGVRNDGGVSTLYEINVETPGATFRADAQGFSDVRGLAPAPDGGFYAVTFTTGGRRLWHMDALSGAGTDLGIIMAGPLGFGGIQALATSPGGTLYAWDIDGGLITIEPATAQAQYVNRLAVNEFLHLQSIAFDPLGRLFGVTAFEVSGSLGPAYSLFEIDLVTGRPSLVGSFGSNIDVRGIEFIPAPGAAAVIGAAAFMGAARRRRR